jgi:hypothetical protein|nr:MAG TPA: hypothetical protein [Caudoviricetes sp.]
MENSVQANVEKIESEVTPFVESVGNFVVNDQASFDQAGQMVADFKKYEKVIKENKEKITKPLNEALKNARALFKPIEEKISVSKRDLLARINAYKFEQDEIARKQAAKLEEKIENGTIKRPETILKNMDKINHVDMAASALSETTKKEVHFDLREMDQKYIMELLERPKVKDAISVEISKDALGNKTRGIEPRIEKGVTVNEVKVVR